MKVAIIYATKYGSTAECAEQIAAKLKDDAETETIVLTKNSQIDLSRYDMVILGSGTYGNMVLGPMREFCATNLSRLLEKRVALFFLGIFEDDKLAREKLVAYPTSLQAHAFAYDCFGGVIDFEKLGFFARQFVRSFGVKESFSTIDPKKIEAFVAAVRTETTSAPEK